MLIGSLLDIFCFPYKTMLKRRASKRFVLAESGQDDVAWDSTVDNNEVQTSSENSVNDSEQNLNLLTTGQMNEGLK